MTDAQSTDERLDAAGRHVFHTDAELVRRWIRAQRPAKRGGMYLWSKVGRQFSVGSTSAQNICRRHGYDPFLAVIRRG